MTDLNALLSQLLSSDDEDEANLADTPAGASQAAVSSLPASSPLSDADRHRSDQRPHSAELLVLGSEVQTPDRAISTAQSTSGLTADEIFGAPQPEEGASAPPGPLPSRMVQSIEKVPHVPAPPSASSSSGSSADGDAALDNLLASLLSAEDMEATTYAQELGSRTSTSASTGAHSPTKASTTALALSGTGLQSTESQPESHPVSQQQLFQQHANAASAPPAFNLADAAYAISFKASRSSAEEPEMPALPAAAALPEDLATLLEEGASLFPDTEGGLSGSDEEFEQDASLIASPDVQIQAPAPASLPVPHAQAPLPAQAESPSAAAQAAASAGRHDCASLDLLAGQSSTEALQQALALEQALTAGTGGSMQPGGQPVDPAAAMRRQLAAALEQWPATGGIDARGAQVGGKVMLRADAVTVIEDALRGGGALGQATCVAAFHAVVAVGTFSGVALVLLPRGIGADGQLSGQPHLMQVGQPSAAAGASHAVTCLSFSPQGSLLLSGHANGDVTFWELRRTAWEPVKVLTDAHVAAVEVCGFAEGGATALTADAQGRLLLHPLSTYLSLAAKFASRLTRAVQPGLLTDGRQMGRLCLLQPLPQANVPSGASQPGQAQGQDAGRAAFMQERSRTEGLVLLGSAKGVWICRAAEPARLAVLHVLAAPDAAAGQPPCASWRQYSNPAAGTQPMILLAVAWGAQVSVHTLALPAAPQQRPSEAAPAAAPTAASMPEPKLLAQWTEAAGVAAVHWLDGPALTVLHGQEQRYTMMRLYDPGGVQHEQLLLGSALLHTQGGGQLSGNTAATSDRLLCLSSAGVQAARVLQWQERLAVLRGSSMWEAALGLGLQLLAAAQGQGQVPAAAPQSIQTLWRCEGRAAPVEAVAARLVQLLLSYLEAVVRPRAGASAEDEAQAQRAAEVALQLALALGRADVLWQEAFPRFAAAHQIGSFMRALVPCILSGRLSSLAPEVVQALVEQCVAQGEVATVERCVLHLDIASLDINQVARLSRKHALYSALTFIYTHALDDYVAPIAELVAAMVADTAAGGSAQRHLGFKLLAFLHCCLHGRTFPPGSGELDPSKGGLVRAQVLGFVLFADHASVRALANAFGDSEAELPEAAWESLLPGPHPILRRLLGTSAGAMLLLLRQALQGWDALEVELREAARLPGADTASVSSAAQCCANALVALLDEPALDQEAARSEALVFVMELVVEGRAAVPVSTGDAILSMLAQLPPAAALAKAGDRESLFVAVLKALYAQGLPAGVKGKYEALAASAGFHKALAETLHAQGNYAEALHSLLQHDPSGVTALQYVARALEEAARKPQAVSRVRDAVLGSLLELAQANAAGTAMLILKRFPTEQLLFVRRLDGCGQVQLQLLQAFMAADASTDASAGQAAAGHSSILQQTQVGELYIRLACQYSPRGVLPFLQASDAYRIEAMLGLTQQHGVSDAQAYLLERLGDVQAALGLLCADVESSTQSVIAAILNGTLQAEDSLPRTSTKGGETRALFVGGAHRTMSQPASSLLASAQAVEAAQALVTAMALCQRHSSPEAAAAAAEQLWFRLLHSFVQLLFNLRRAEPQRVEAPLLRRHSSETSSSGGGRGQEATRQALAQEVLTGFMEEVIAAMARCLPLKAIGERVLALYHAHEYGDFKGTIQGLLAAYSYESSILQSANRLVAADAYHGLHALYSRRKRAIPA